MLGSNPRHLSTYPTASIISGPLILLLISFLPYAPVSPKVFERCELIDELVDQGFLLEDLGDWTCIASIASGLNSSFFHQPNIDNITNYGMFKVYFRFEDPGNNMKNKLELTYRYITSGGVLMVLKSRTDVARIAQKELVDFLDDDLDDDIQCVDKIYKMHNFTAWDEWVSHCEGRDLRNYTEGCLEDRQPQIDPPSNEVFKRGVSNQFLSCRASGYPKPELNWKYNEATFPDAWTLKDPANDEPGTTRIKLIFRTVDFNQGEFLCEAFNGFARVNASFVVTVVDEEDKSEPIPYEVIIPATMAGIILIIVLSLLLHRTYLLKVYGLTDEEIELFRNGLPSSKKNSILAPGTMEADDFLRLPYDNSKFEIESGQIQIEKDQVLGSGHFGNVFKAKLNGEIVAVKTPKSSGGYDTSHIKALLTELKVMIHLGQHPGVVNLIGALTEGLRKGELYIVVEFSELGDLQQYLQKRRLYYVDQVLPTGYISGGMLSSEAANDDPMTYLDLLTWATQIASGMAHLEKMKVLHGDLAARNVLLVNKFTAKVSDFGLAKQLYSKLNYVKNEESLMPWRWMALECLTNLCFSTKSDVWSFGVTLWEIFTLGEVPYPGLVWSQEFSVLLKQGMRLVRPEHASEEIYGMMTNCWLHDPHARPDFGFLHNALTKIKAELQYP